MWRSNAYFRWLLGWHSGTVLFCPDYTGVLQVADRAGRFSSFCVSSLVFPKPLVNQESESCDSDICLSVLQTQTVFCVGSREGKPSRASDYNIQKESTLSLMWSLRVDGHLLGQNL